MKAEQTTFLDFIEGKKKQFIIPVYQRNYNWERKQCEQLLNDINNIIKNKLNNYFFGSIVSISSTSDRDKILIIDGQQRLTTVSLLLLAIYKLLDSKQKEAKLDKQEIYETYLINRFHKSEQEDAKIKLKPIKSDRECFNKLFKDEEETEQVELGKIYANYCFFKKKLLELDLDDVYLSVQQLMIVDVQLEQGKDDPQLIFESLNSTGLALNESDKIRNFILMNENEKRQEKFFSNYWIKIEEYTLDKTSEFIRDFLSYKTRKIPNKSAVYFYFKEFYSKEVSDKEVFLQEFLQYSKYYNFILKPKKFKQSKKIVSLLENLLTLEVKVFNPALLELFSDYEQEKFSIKEFENILEIIINYVFRRELCNIPTNGLNKVFLTLISDVKKYDLEKTNYIDILKYILSQKNSTAKFPTDEELRNSLSVREIYFMKKSRYYFFEILEKYENRETVDMKNGADDEKTQIEHIIPQKITSQWKKDLGENWEEIHNKYLHTIGNLTLTKYNNEMSNLPFSEKKKKGFNDSRFFLNQDLKNIEVFNEEELKKRQKNLVDRVIKIWYYPQTDYKPFSKIKNYYSLADHLYDFTGKYIKAIILKDNKEVKADSWKFFYCEVINFLLDYDFGYFQEIQQILGENNINTLEENMRSPFEVYQSIYLETHSSTEQKLENLQKIADKTEFDLNDFKFTIDEESN